ncbi:hypothetical protein SZ54_4431 [Rhizobium sp. UR51a]|nr:hypothetical protein SZ54_4431 [Rhizobium sp. UR51a]
MRACVHHGTLLAVCYRHQPVWSELSDHWRSGEYQLRVKVLKYLVPPECPADVLSRRNSCHHPVRRRCSHHPLREWRRNRSASGRDRASGSDPSRTGSLPVSMVGRIPGTVGICGAA